MWIFLLIRGFILLNDELIWLISNAIAFTKLPLEDIVDRKDKAKKLIQGAYLVQQFLVILALSFSKVIETAAEILEVYFENKAQK